ncbi:class I SAM-dependent methyltransferase [Proteinivorax tanatarense]|uniref:Class I SAM-dependent methyltransferase n=1 Tax=Proteinivorax tanatarense TaxID=1260629 RepID=A0AAU7VPP7_9FIRM
MKITSRLKAVANLVGECKILADIGTDHCYIPIYLLKKGKTNNAIASDINEGPLQAAEETVKKNNLNEKVSIRLGNGLAPLKENDFIDVIVIAGMGGETIVNILENIPCHLTKCRYILQPMTDISLVRKWLDEKSYKITNEEIAKEVNRYYTVIEAQHQSNAPKLSEIETQFGPVLLKKKHPLLKEYIVKRRNKNIEVFSQIQKIECETLKRDKNRTLRREKDLLEEVLRWL